MANQQVTDALLSQVDGDIALVLLAGAALIGVTRRARQPHVIGEILAGIALGPSLLGLLPGHLDRHLFPADARPYLSAIAQLGLLLFMFTIGWELDPARLRRLRRSAGVVSLGAMTFPFVIGFAIAALFYDGHSIGGADAAGAAGSGGTAVGFWRFALYFGTCLSITAFPVLARILADSSLLTTRIGEFVMATAALTDVAAWCLLAAVSALVTAGNASHILVVLGWSALYVVGLWYVVRPLLRLLFAHLDDLPRAYAPTLCTAGLLLSSWATEAIGIHAIFGAFAFGLAMPRESKAAVETRVASAYRSASSLLLPVYFIVVGLSVDVRGLRAGDYGLLALAVTAASVGKILGTAVPARLTGWSRRESAVIGILMNTRGLTEIIVLNLGLSLGLLDKRQFTVLILTALITTCATGPLVDRLLPGVFATEPKPEPEPDVERDVEPEPEPAAQASAELVSPG